MMTFSRGLSTAAACRALASTKSVSTSKAIRLTGFTDSECDFVNAVSACKCSVVDINGDAIVETEFKSSRS